MHPVANFAFLLMMRLLMMSPKAVEQLSERCNYVNELVKVHLNRFLEKGGIQAVILALQKFGTNFLDDPRK